LKVLGTAPKVIEGIDFSKFREVEERPLACPNPDVDA
jgi:hypothetical protein